jgi:hypothetical protein
MNTRALLFTLAVLAICLGPVQHAPAQDGDKVRNWRSTNGKSIRGELIEVRDGKAIIRPATKLIEAPLDKLTQTDREYVEAWKVENEKLMKERAEADQIIAQQKPLGKALMGRTVIVKGKKVENYKVENIGKLKYVLLYRATDESNQHVDELNGLYRRLKSRYDSVEFIAIAYGKNAEKCDAFLINNEIKFPAVRMSSLNIQGVQPITQLFDRTVVPQIAVIDASGKIVSDSYNAPDPEKEKKRRNGKDGEWTGPKQDYKRAIDGIVKLLRDAAKKTPGSALGNTAG